METKQKSNNITLFFVAAIVFNMAASFAHPVTPTLIQEYHLNDYMFGVALAVMQCAYFLMSPFWGKLNNYIASRKSMLICCLGYAVGQALFGMARTESMVIFARVFAGMFTGGAFTSFLTYIVNTSSDMERGRNLTIFATIQTVAGAFGYFVGGFLGEVSLNVTFAAQTACLALAGIAFFFICRDDRPADAGKIEPKRLVREANPFAAFVACRHFMTVLFAVLFASACLYNLGYTAFEQCFNYYIKDALGLTSKYNGLIKGVIGFVSLAANATICMWIIKKTNVRRSIVLVLGLGAVAITGVVFADSTLPFMGISVLFYAIYAVSLPLLQDLVARRAAHTTDSNLVMGFFNSTRSLGGIVGSLCAGFLYSSSPKSPFVFAAIALALSTLCALIYAKAKNDPYPDDAK
ncbi:MAG: MFS transporter [Clostridiaceae bacterium]|jgi:DHA1 family multidrug resistance protein-like MFS transporter|nr:MFS transporter [Clostridiaceae bacterium]